MKKMSNKNELKREESSKQHGVGGVYYGGDWVDIEDCADTFLVEESKCSGCQNSKQIRSASSNYQPQKVEYDVIIIGAGCIGAAVARELSKTTLSVLWLESADDVSQGATKGNSGIVHAGYDDKPGSLHAKFCWPGNQLFRQLDRELRFGYQVNGSLVLATNEEEIQVLKQLMGRGIKNGVQNLRIIEKEELFEMEPHLHPNCIAALYAPDAGNVIPYEFTIAMAENAVDNGVELRIRRQVQHIQSTSSGFMVQCRYWEPNSYIQSIQKHQFSLNKLGGIVAAGMLALACLTVGQPQGASFGNVSTLKPSSILVAILSVLYMLYELSLILITPTVSQSTPMETLVKQVSKLESQGGRSVSVDDMKVGGSGSAQLQHAETVRNEKFVAKYIINCAGSYSDQIAHMIGDDSFTIKPRLGDYLLLNRNQGKLTHRTLFPTPDPVLGKGVLVQTTLWGNLILGPTARDTKDYDWSAQKIQEYILSKCQALVPSFDATQVIHAFCGARAKSNKGDWIIEHSSINNKMIHVSGIDSPGLAGSPAIAQHVVKLLQQAGCTLQKDPTFNPNRAPIIIPKNGMRGLKMGPVGKNDSDGINEQQMKQNVICKCEKVTEYEVVTALRRSLPIDSTQGIRKRTRAGMGHCQGDPDNYHCEARVKAIIARETGIPLDQIGGRPWPATSTLSQRWPEEQELEAMQERKTNPKEL